METYMGTGGSKRNATKKEKNQPSSIDRVHFSQWILSEMEKAMKDKGGFDSHRRPDKGNHLDHDLLFGDQLKIFNPLPLQLASGEFTLKSI